jgi:hypothetical protein
VKTLWKSLREYASVVAKQWWFYVGLVSGILALAGQVTSVPPVPRGISIAGFVVFLSVAQFAAFHQLRLQRDAGTRPRMTILSKPKKWGVTAIPYALATGQPFTAAQQEMFKGDPELNIAISGDVTAAASGGETGGVLHDITWSIRNLPGGLTTRAMAGVDTVALAPNMTVVLTPTLEIYGKAVRLSQILDALTSSNDLAIVASYRAEAGTTAAETAVKLPREELIEPLTNWGKYNGTI